MSVREPAVAGMFYAARADDLRRQIEACFLGSGGPGSLPSVSRNGQRQIIALISPHAGYVYSGSTAAWTYYRLAEDGLPETAVVIGPNHRSYHPAVALCDDTAWRTPLGDIELDACISAEIASAYPARVESIAHRGEHSIEVQIPFLQYIAEICQTPIRIVPILIGASARLETAGGEKGLAHRLGNAIALAIENKSAVVIASTDFSHYEPSEVARTKDSRAISCILGLDEDCLLEVVDSLQISMCGVLPTAVAITAAKRLGGTSARQLAYRNSGEVTGDFDQVVGYAALEIDR
ncbi:MAG: AmmeMemoRadiSam system protein B [Armatimonadetes bacterium]|nr:AmmeMemoRadiSam system protein B [Armatimonadota bacterium]